MPLPKLSETTDKELRQEIAKRRREVEPFAFVFMFLEKTYRKYLSDVSEEIKILEDELNKRNRER